MPGSPGSPKMRLADSRLSKKRARWRESGGRRFRSRRTSFILGPEEAERLFNFMLRIQYQCWSPWARPGHCEFHHVRADSAYVGQENRNTNAQWDDGHGKTCLASSHRTFFHGWKYLLSKPSLWKEDSKCLLDGNWSKATGWGIRGKTTNYSQKKSLNNHFVILYVFFDTKTQNPYKVVPGILLYYS